MFNQLNLNKDEVKKSVILRLKKLGYKVEEDSNISEIQEIVGVIQRDNGLIIDRCIGRKTMALMGYTDKEIREMLKVPKGTRDFSFYPFWILLH